MAFYGYNGDVDQFYSTPYDYDYDPIPVQASSHHSSPYEFGEPQLTEHYRDDSFVTPVESNYSVYTDPAEYNSSYYYDESSVYSSQVHYIEPKFLQFEPSAYYQGYFPSETRFTISYSSVEFNEPDFEEYDPTPYGGGYDLVTTYGKPLPPSDTICYPRTLPQSGGSSLENFSYASIPSPYVKDDDPPAKPIKENKPIETKTEIGNGDKVSSDGKVVETVDMIPSDDSSSHENQNGFENGKRGDYVNESDRQVTQIPYGSGLEAIDLCESIFGYWPCLAKIEKEQKERDHCRFCNQETRRDPWETAADYLFGSPLVYDYEHYHHHRHHQPQYWYNN